MPRYAVTVVTEWLVEVEADDEKWAATIAVEQHEPSSENITNENTYVDLIEVAS